MEIEPEPREAAEPAMQLNARAYLDAVMERAETCGGLFVSIVLFGSAATGGFSSAVSDVDLILVLRDGTSARERQRVLDDVEGLEVLHGVRNKTGKPRPLERIFDRLTNNVRSFFVCTRGDLLSGRAGCILGLSAAQAVFVDGVVVPSIVKSGRTVWGENLLPQVPLVPIRRFDVFKALFGVSSQALVCVAAYPLLPSATRYAMDTLKRSVHNCYFCYHGHTAPLAEEVAFFQARGVSIPALTQLLALRGDYRPSPVFVLRCLPAMVRLHLRTASENRFPRAV